MKEPIMKFIRLVLVCMLSSWSCASSADMWTINSTTVFTYPSESNLTKAMKNIVEEYRQGKLENTYVMLQGCSKESGIQTNSFGVPTSQIFEEIWCLVNLAGFHKYGIFVPKNHTTAIDLYFDARRRIRDAFNAASSKYRFIFPPTLKSSLEWIGEEARFELVEIVLLNGEKYRNMGSVNKESTEALTEMMKQGKPRAAALYSYLVLVNQPLNSKEYEAMINNLTLARKSAVGGLYGESTIEYINQLTKMAYSEMEQHEKQHESACKSYQRRSDPNESSMECNDRIDGTIICRIFSPIEICSLKVNDGNCRFSSSAASMQRYMNIINKRDFLTGDEFRFMIPRCKPLVLEVNSDPINPIKLRIKRP